MKKKMGESHRKGTDRRKISIDNRIKETNIKKGIYEKE
jgi:hypothetical protein